MNETPNQNDNGFSKSVMMAVLSQLFLYFLSGVLFVWLIEGSIHEGPLGELRIPFWAYTILFPIHGSLTLFAPGYLIDKNLHCPVCGEPIADWYRPALKVKILWKARKSCHKCHLDFSKFNSGPGGNE